jgi:hypothetical protein
MTQKQVVNEIDGNIMGQVPEAIFLVMCEPSMNELWAT